MPATGIELRQCAPGVLASHHTDWCAPASKRIGAALQIVVMQQKWHTVLAQFDIAFKHPVAMAGADTEGGQSILRCEFARTPVGDPTRVGPVVGADLHHSLRLPLLTSNQCSLSARGVTWMVLPMVGTDCPSSVRTITISSPVP